MDKYRFLIIDDDQDTLSLLDNILYKEFEVFCYTIPVDCLNELEDIEPDIFIIDVMMPHMDGREMVKRIRKKPQFAKTPVVFLSVLTDRQVIIDAYKSGADLFLTKPITPRRFMNSIHAFLKRNVVPKRRKLFSVSELTSDISKLKTPIPKDRKSSRPTTPPPTFQAKPRQSHKTAPPKRKPHDKESPENKRKNVSAPYPIPTHPPVARKVCRLPRILIAIDDKETLSSLSEFKSLPFETVLL